MEFYEFTKKKIEAERKANAKAEERAKRSNALQMVSSFAIPIVAAGSGLLWEDYATFPGILRIALLGFVASVLTTIVITH